MQAAVNREASDFLVPVWDICRPAMARKCQLLRCCYVAVSFIVLAGQYVHTVAEVEITEVDDGGEVDRRTQLVSQLQAELVQEISQHKCNSETGASSLAHEDVLNRMNGKKLVYIGDSVTRLALFAVCLLTAVTCLESSLRDCMCCQAAIPAHNQHKSGDCAHCWLFLGETSLAGSHRYFWLPVE